MVDPVNASGQVQGVLSVNTKPQKQDKSAEDKQRADAAAERKADEVKLSEEALSLSTAEKKAEETRAALAADQSQTLSSDQQRLSTLV
ncbi:MAG: hypothetical protein KDI13_09345 [Alphaproteobacteria bacterium]|nr:hypothetical protein [Alphaproteobacteria bacterium]